MQSFFTRIESGRKILAPLFDHVAIVHQFAQKNLIFAVFAAIAVVQRGRLARAAIFPHNVALFRVGVIALCGSGICSCTGWAGRSI
jgi:hypothetical protein